VNGAAATVQTKAEKMVIGHKGKAETQTNGTKPAVFISGANTVKRNKRFVATKN